MEIVEKPCSRCSDQNSCISVPLVLDCPLLCHRLQAVGRPLSNVWVPQPHWSERGWITSRQSRRAIGGGESQNPRQQASATIQRLKPAVMSQIVAEMLVSVVRLSGIYCGYPERDNS